MTNVKTEEIIKFIVVKKEDVNRYLTNIDKENLINILDDITYKRMRDGKSLNTYIVINHDEPYIDEVIDILKRNGHWG